MLRDSRSGARSLRITPRAAIGVIGLAAAASLTLGACSSDSTGPGSGGGDGCQSNRAYFEEQVWSPFMGQEVLRLPRIQAVKAIISRARSSS